MTHQMIYDGLGLFNLLTVVYLFGSRRGFERGVVKGSRHGARAAINILEERGLIKPEAGGP